MTIGSEKLSDYDFTAGALGKYPAEWFDGNAYRITRECEAWGPETTAKTFTNRLSSIVRSRGMKIRVRTEDPDTIVIQVHNGED